MISLLRFTSCLLTRGRWCAVIGTLMFLAGTSAFGAVLYPFQRLPDVTIGENGSGGFDVDLNSISSRGAEIKMSARSSNVDLIRPDGVTFSQQNGILNVKLDPLSCQSGVSTIVLIATDGASTNQSAFQLTVTQPLGLFPRIFGLPDDVMIIEDEPLNVRFSSVPYCSSNALTVSANSSTSGLFLTNKLEFIGSGTNWLMHWIPEKGMTGVGIINVVVREGNTSVSEGFVVRVGQSNAMGHPFLHAITDKGIAEGTPIIIPLEMDNVAPPDINLTQFSAEISNTNLVPGSGVTFIKTGTNVSLRLEPALCALGFTTVNVSFRTGGELTMTEFLLTVAERDSHLNIMVPGTLEGYENESFTVLPFVNIRIACRPIGTFLRVLALNSNLFPATGVSVTGAGTNWTVKLTPSLDQSGESEVLFFIYDSEGYGTQTDTRVIVHALNNPPTISRIEDQKVKPGELRALSFLISDPDNDPSEITARVSSSNTNIVANADLTLSHQGTNYLLMLRTQTNTAGITEITVQAWDPSASAAATAFFLVSGTNGTRFSIMSVKLQPDHRIKFDISGNPGATGVIQASTDLFWWQNGTTIKLDSDGKAAWTNATMGPLTFFRLQN